MIRTQTDRQNPTRALWSRDFVLNLIVAHCVFVAYTAMSPIIPLYAEHRGLTDLRLPIGVGDFALVISQEFQLGVIVGSFGLIGLIVRPYTGRWVYTIGAKRIAVIGPIALGAATMLHIFAVRAWMIIPARVAQGIGLALGPVTTSTIAANLAPDHRRAEGLSYMSNIISFSMVYSPPLAFLIYELFGFSASFIYAGAVAFVGSAVAMGMSAERVRLPRRQDAGDDKVPLINKRALFPMTVFLTYTFTTAPVYLFMPGIAEDRGFGNPGLYFTANSITSMVTLLVSGRLSDRFGRGAMIVPGLLTVAAGMFLLATAEVRWLFWLSGSLSGLGFGMIQPSMQSWTVERVPPHERSSAMATLQQAWDIGGSSIGAFTMGAIGAVTGAAATFAIAGSGSALGATGFVAGHPETRKVGARALNSQKALQRRIWRYIRTR